jgi:hypothetical protein
MKFHGFQDAPQDIGGDRAALELPDVAPGVDQTMDELLFRIGKFIGMNFRGAGSPGRFEISFYIFTLHFCDEVFLRPPRDGMVGGTS